MFNKVFIKSFLKPEFKFLSGKYFSNLQILILILTLSMLAIGLGNGVVEYMKSKMDSPFISFINVSIPHDRTSLDLDNETLNNAFVSDTVYNFPKDSINYKEYFNITADPIAEFRSYCNVFNPFNNRDKQGLFKMSLHNDPLLLFLKKEGKLPADFQFRDAKNGEIGCVVSKDFAKKLMYDEDQLSYLFLKIKISDEYKLFPIPVFAVVDRLPDGIHVICGNSAFNIITGSSYMQNSLSESCDSSDKFIFIPESLDIKPQLKQLNSTRYMTRNSEGTLYQASQQQSRKFLDKSDKGVVVFSDYLGLINLTKDIDEIYKEVYPFSFNPNNLNRVDEFSKFLKKHFKLKVDLTIIEKSKNFDIFNKVAKLLSFSLIFFSIFSMVMFITNLIVNHISKNRKNLGTLKAFGMSNKSIVMVYSSISLALILISFLVGYLFSTFVGNISITLFARAFDIPNASQLAYSNYSILTLFIFFVLVPFALVVIKLISSLKGNTPGDLIYER